MSALIKIEESDGVVIGGLLPDGHWSPDIGDYGIKAGVLRRRVRLLDAVAEAAAVRAQLLRELREFGSGYEGWCERDIDSDEDLLAAVEAWQQGCEHHAEEGK